MFCIGEETIGSLLGCVCVYICMNVLRDILLKELQVYEMIFEVVK